jgi:hypothetical protein
MATAWNLSSSDGWDSRGSGAPPPAQAAAWFRLQPHQLLLPQQQQHSSAATVLSCLDLLLAGWLPIPAVPRLGVPAPARRLLSTLCWGCRSCCACCVQGLCWPRSCARWRPCGRRAGAANSLAPVFSYENCLWASPAKGQPRISAAVGNRVSVAFDSRVSLLRALSGGCHQWYPVRAGRLGQVFLFGQIHTTHPILGLKHVMQMMQERGRITV